MSVTIITVALHFSTLMCVSVTNWNQSNVINLTMYYVSVNIQEILLSNVGGKVSLRSGYIVGITHAVHM